MPRGLQDLHPTGTVCMQACTYSVQIHGTAAIAKKSPFTALTWMPLCPNDQEAADHQRKLGWPTQTKMAWLMSCI